MVRIATTSGVSAQRASHGMMATIKDFRKLGLALSPDSQAAKTGVYRMALKRLTDNEFDFVTISAMPQKSITPNSTFVEVKPFYDSLDEAMEVAVKKTRLASKDPRGSTLFFPVQAGLDITKIYRLPTETLEEMCSAVKNRLPVSVINKLRKHAERMNKMWNSALRDEF